MKKVMNLKDLKKSMWFEVCKGYDIKMSDEFKKLVSGIGDEEVNGRDFVDNFYKLLDILIENNLIEFEGGDFDWLYNELGVYGEEDNWNVYYKEYMDLLNNIK